jgi:hypothetical protein
MSIKTLRKRIALVAVSALGAGLMSVVAVPTANAADFDLAASAVYGNKGVITAATVGTVASPGTTGVLELGGYVSFTVDADNGSDDYTLVKVSGGTVEALGLGTVATDSKSWYVIGDGSNGPDLYQLRFRPSAAGTNMSVTVWDDADADLVADSDETSYAYILYNVYTAGLTAVAPANSRVNVVADDSTTYTGTADTVYANAVKNGNEGRINVKLYNGLGTAYSTDNIAVTAQVTSGDCLVGATDAQTQKFYNPTTSSGQIAIFTAQGTTNTPTVCVVAISVDGTTVATKTIVHQGPVASLTVSGVETADSGGSAQTGLADVVAKDSAGNVIGNVAIAEGNGTNGVASTLTFTNSNATAAGSTSINSGAAASSTPTSLGWTCSGVKGTASMTVKHTPSNGVAIHSNTFTAACYGDAVNYKASFDKASYVPGDIATLTITGTDSSGNPANDQEAIGTATTYEVAIAGSNMTAVTAATNADKFTAGKKTYKFIVGSTEGSYQMSVDLPKFNSTTYSQAAVTVAYSIKASSATVTNAEVLAAIVKLIASINKQIRALQKSLKR